MQSNKSVRNVFSVFIGSPSDVVPERQIAREVVEEVNRNVAKPLNWEIELLGWEDTMPNYGRPQSLINDDVDRCHLFLGLLWRRWGSATGEYSSGFEEEFERAITRRRKESQPDMWLFFKDIEADLLSDPGDQLRAVLAFRDAVRTSREVLYKTVKDGAQWREMLREYLSKRIIELEMNSREEQQPSDHSSRPVLGGTEETTAGGLAERGLETLEELEQVRGALAEVERNISQASDDLVVTIDNIAEMAIVRHFLFASTMMSRLDAHLLGTHDANFVYRYRKSIEATPLEVGFLIRSMIADQHGLIPGYYWYRDEDERTVAFFLLLFGIHGRGDNLRVRAIQILRESGISPSDQREQIVSVALNDTESELRKEVIRYLATMKDRAALRSIQAGLGKGNRSPGCLQ